MPKQPVGRDINEPFSDDIVQLQRIIRRVQESKRDTAFKESVILPIQGVIALFNEDQKRILKAG